MKTDSFTATLPVSNRFSWRRTAMTGIFYRHQIKRQLTIYAAIITGLFILSALPGRFFGFMQSLEGTALSFMFYLGPIVFAGNSRVTETMLPARASEKFCFYLLYSFVIIPFFIYGGWTLLWGCFQWIDGTMPFWELGKRIVSADELNLTKEGKLINMLTDFTPTVTVLWISLTAKSSPILKAIVGALATLMTIGLIAGITGFICAINSVRISDIDNISPDQVAEAIKNDVLVKLICVIATCSALYIVTGLTISYRKIAHRQI